MKTTKITKLAGIATASVAAAIALPVAAHADDMSECSSGQVQVSNGGEQSASGHREVLLIFSLAPGAAPCTLTGYPGVDSGAGGPLIHADRTLSGAMGGARTGTFPITVWPWQPAYAVVEGLAVDPSDYEGRCPTYTDLQVTAPDSYETVTIPVGHLDTCELQVNPVGSGP